MTPDEITELRRLEREATPEPWDQEEYESALLCLIRRRWDSKENRVCSWDGYTRPNSYLIVALRNSITALLDALEAERVRVKENADAAAISRNHELTGLHDECACSSCNLHRRMEALRHRAEVYRKGFEALLAELDNCLDPEVSDQTNEQIGYWESLNNHPDVIAAREMGE